MQRLVSGRERSAIRRIAYRRVEMCERSCADGLLGAQSAPDGLGRLPHLAALVAHMLEHIVKLLDAQAKMMGQIRWPVPAHGVKGIDATEPCQVGAGDAMNARHDLIRRRCRSQERLVLGDLVIDKVKARPQQGLDRIGARRS